MFRILAMTRSFSGIETSLTAARRQWLGAAVAMAVSLALGVTIALLLLSPTSRETLELSAYLAISGLVDESESD